MTGDTHGWRFEGSNSTPNIRSGQLPAALNLGFGAALSAAILEAQTVLKTDLVSWVVADSSGQFGGFTEVCEVKVGIYARSGPS